MNPAAPFNTELPDEIITALCNREGDVAGMREMRYRGVVLDVFRDMNLYAIKYAKRVWLPVDRQTNTIITPQDFLLLSSLSAPNDCDKLVTLVLNQNIQHDIVDLSIDRDCKCQCGCKSDLCGMTKYYEPILETVYELLPDQSYGEFKAVTRKLLKNGTLYTEKTFPIIKYNAAGEHTATELTTELEEMCKLDVKDCGCIAETDANKKAIGDCCGAANYATDCGCPSCPVDSPEGFNFTESGNRIALPSSFTGKKALVRYYAESNVSDMRVPLIAKECFIDGLKSFTIPFDEKMPKWRIDLFDKRYDDKKRKLFTLYNRFSLKRFLQMVVPNIDMP